MEPALTLANTPLDLQITICMFLHPSDILALRKVCLSINTESFGYGCLKHVKTCKALELATRRRIVWVAVLRKVCLDNTLFLPSFPISDMSDLELERAAMGPHRWIQLFYASQRQHSNGFSETLQPRKIRDFEDGDKSNFYIVPGGRYMVIASDTLSVWDLGYISTVDCELVASVELDDYCYFLEVQATPDGMGLVILIAYW